MSLCVQFFNDKQLSDSRTLTSYGLKQVARLNLKTLGFRFAAADAAALAETETEQKHEDTHEHTQERTRKHEHEHEQQGKHTRTQSQAAAVANTKTHTNTNTKAKAKTDARCQTWAQRCTDNCNNGCGTDATCLGCCATKQAECNDAWVTTYWLYTNPSSQCVSPFSPRSVFRFRFVFLFLCHSLTL